VLATGIGLGSILINYALENGKSVNPSGIGVEESVANRLTAPSNVGGYGSGVSGVWPSGTGNLEPTAYQGIWLRLTLDQDQLVNSARYNLRGSGYTS